MVKNYTTQTASLKTTFADVRKLDVKKIKVDNKDVATSVKHPNDTRETITENDIWGSWAEITSKGEIVFHEDKINISDTSWFDFSNSVTITKVEDNKVYTSVDGNDVLIANIETDKIEDATEMFYENRQLQSFESDLSTLKISQGMFQNCGNLISFKSSNLNNLIDGKGMFVNSNRFSSFEGEMPNLRDGFSMFSLTSIQKFICDTKSLINGFGMFQYTGLKTVVMNLSSLTNGYDMFLKCKLDTDSLFYIAETINDVTSLTNGENIDSNVNKKIHIGIGNTTPTPEEHEYLTEIHNKGWEVFVNGSSDVYVPPTDGTSIIPIGEEENSTPIPFYAKPIETIEANAKYVGEDGKYYNILGGQFIYVNDPETYGMFVSEEDAAANMRLSKIEK